MGNSVSHHSLQEEVVLVVDFGAQYAQLIARRVRQAGVYSEIVSHKITAAQVVAKKPKAIVLSGGPSSVYENGAPNLDSEIFKTDIPIFGICYGFQVMANALGGVVTKTGNSEFGRTKLIHENNSKLLKDLPKEFSVWMSHGDSVTQAPAGFVVTASSVDCPIAAYESSDGKIAGVQFHPEVVHSEYGQTILKNWLIDVAKCQPTWTTKNIVEFEIS